jgi:hypothetical protein
MSFFCDSFRPGLAIVRTNIVSVLGVVNALPLGLIHPTKWCSMMRETPVHRSPHERALFYLHLIFFV